MADRKIPRVNIRFLFGFCNDLSAMRRFYSELLGLQELDYQEQYGYLTYQSEGWQFMLFKAKKEIPVLTKWTDQPGYQGGELQTSSIAVEVPEEQYPETYIQLRDARVKMFNDRPEWRMDSYWGLSVMDPMGNTMEVYTIPKVKPEKKEWMDK